ncbi:MAG: AarF/UbiB family protein, partial [Pseudomonadota bacterium]
IRMTGMIPKGMDISPLLEAARAQLHEEADYTREAEQLAAFGTRLAGDPRFLVPGVHADLSSRTVLAMDFVESTPLEETDRGQAVTEALIWLFLTELFDWHAMQTDPNFANYRWQADTGRIVLLDFGAARSFDPAAMAPYRDLLRAGFAEDDRAVIAALRDLGFLGESTPERAERVILDLFRTAFSPVTALSHDFATCKMVEQLRAAGMDLVDDRGTFPLPPADALFIQRKIGGMYLLAKRLGATVDLGAIVTPFR